MAASTLISTVGTSLFFPNLSGLSENDADTRRAALAAAYRARDWQAVSLALGEGPSGERLCGAEINSIDSLLRNGLIAEDCNLFFCHSQTEDGRAIGGVLQSYFRARRHPQVELREIADLQDADPRRFKTRGLRNLAKEICAVIRAFGPAQFAVNATGGYEAKIAIAVMMGQALNVRVYYKHERFDDIIAFPPMPISLDYRFWMEASGLLSALQRTDVLALADLDEALDEKCESLVDREVVDGVEYLSLSPAGQIFHETFRERFRTDRDRILPPPAAIRDKRPPRLERSGWPGQHPEVAGFLERLTGDVPQVVQCATFYFNPDLPQASRFRLGRDGIEGILSNGTYTVKFRVESTAQNEGQQAAVLAALNEWLDAEKLFFSRS